MRVDANYVVTLDYSVSDDSGRPVDDGAEPIVYLHGGQDLFPGLQTALAGAAQGDRVTATLSPAEAFGDYDSALLRVEPPDAFPAPPQPGMQFEGMAEDGSALLYTVTEVADDRVVVDGNHPLAGLSLVFSMTVTGIRPATAEELAAGAARRG